MKFIVEIICPKKIKDGLYVINLDKYSNIGTHLIALYAMNNNITYFDSFVVEHVTKEIKKFISRSLITINIYRIQGYGSVMCGYFCIGFIDFILSNILLIFFHQIIF